METLLTCLLLVYNAYLVFYLLREKKHESNQQRADVSPPIKPTEKVEDIVMQQAGYYGLPRAYAKTQTEKYLQKLNLWDKRNAPAHS